MSLRGRGGFCWKAAREACELSAFRSAAVGDGEAALPRGAMGTGPALDITGLIRLVLQSSDGRDTLLLHCYL